MRKDRDGVWHVLCDNGDRRVRALGDAGTTELIGQEVELVYSRIDADGSSRSACLPCESALTLVGA